MATSDESDAPALGRWRRGGWLARRDSGTVPVARERPITRPVARAPGPADARTEQCATCHATHAAANGATVRLGAELCAWLCLDCLRKV